MQHSIDSVLRTFGSCAKQALDVEIDACENDGTFSTFLHACAEECLELAREQERQRKNLKETATRDDKQVLDDEAARDKVR